MTHSNVSFERTRNAKRPVRAPVECKPRRKLDATEGRGWIRSDVKRRQSEMMQ